MNFKSTRGKQSNVSSSEAIINGIAADGGLYVPMEFPKIDFEDNDMFSLNYKELSMHIMSKFLTDFNEEELHECIMKAYDSKFDTSLIAPVVEKDGTFYLELYHGPTLAFKDMALSILPHLLTLSKKKKMIKRKIVILTATSGDTGKAALEGFANIKDVLIVVFYPKDGVSEIQKLQMLTQVGENTCVIGIDGNFDDAQNGVKEIFNNSDFIKTLEDNNYMLSSANSINIGRLIPQIVYYFYSYSHLVKNHRIKPMELINVVVPTGNFGNILAAYYAKKMGLPLNKLICASNENNILYDFLTTGIYNKKRDLKLTSSPSMDILISSNLERLLYEISNHDDELIMQLMNKLETQGKYEITEAMKENLSDFYGDFASEVEVFDSISSVYKSSGYLIDTHTAVAQTVYNKYKQNTGDLTKTIIVSTASPFKFGRSVSKALGIKESGLDDFEINEKLSELCGVEIPKGIASLKNKAIVHNHFHKKYEMKLALKKFLKINN
jgi:threonine synthase